MQKVKLHFILLTIHKNLFQMDHRTKCQTWNNKTSGGNMGKNFYNLGLDKDFINTLPEAWFTKTKFIN